MQSVTWERNTRNTAWEIWDEEHSMRSRQHTEGASGTQIMSQSTIKQGQHIKESTAREKMPPGKHLTVSHTGN